ncbi:MAG: ABC transporter ATP-binding protein/permease [Alphaproteobacteria bacterium]
MEDASEAASLGRLRGWGAFFAMFLRLAGPFWAHRGQTPVRLLTVSLIVLTGLQVVIPVAVNLWSEQFFDALEQKAMDRFVLLIGALLLIVAGNMAVTTSHLWIKRRLQIAWRGWLTQRLIDEWMREGRPYRLASLSGEHDNPDGRIAVDIQISTEYAIDLAHSLLYSCLLLISFVQILWSLSGEIGVELGGWSLSLPGHLVWIALLYSAIGTATALLLGRPLIRAANLRQGSEADFRFGLAHARENAFAIAFTRGESNERVRTGGLFHRAVMAWNRQTAALMQIFLFVTSWSVLSQAFPVLVAAPRYLAGTISLGMLMQSAQAFQQMTAALSWPIDNLAKAAEWRASVERVHGLHEAAITADHRTAMHPRRSTLAVADSPDGHLRCTSLAMDGPDGGEINAPFDLDIAPGDRILVTGDPAAAVKLMQVMAGLWPWGQGRVELPADTAVFYMPQNPYLPLGNLRDAVCYPSAAADCGDRPIREALRKVGLEHLIFRLDDEENWENALAPGEQQRLGFARILLHRPRWIFIEEATDALDPQGEEQMLLLLQRTFPDASYVTVGYHPRLETFHRRKLTFIRENGVSVARETATADLNPAAMP